MRLRRLLLVPFIPLGAMVLLPPRAWQLVMPRSYSIACGTTEARVGVRLFDSRTGRGVPGARVLVAAREAAFMDEWMTATRDGSAASWRFPYFAEITTDAEGRGESPYFVASSTSTRGFLWLRRSRHHIDPVVRVLRLEVPGREPVIVRDPPGSWSRGDDGRLRWHAEIDVAAAMG